MNEDLYYERCCGIDVHKKFLMVCLRIGRRTSACPLMFKSKPFHVNSGYIIMPNKDLIVKPIPNDDLNESDVAGTDSKIPSEKRDIMVITAKFLVLKKQEEHSHIVEGFTAAPHKANDKDVNVDDLGRRVLFVVHRREICDQAERTFRRHSVDMTICIVGMVKTLMNSRILLQRTQERTNQQHPRYNF